MTRKLKYTSLLLSLLAAFAACSDEVVDAKDPDQGKSPIELSVGGIDTPSSQTRTVITDGTDKTKHFDENTSLYMLMKSEDITDGTTKPALVTRTIMFALPQTDSSKDYSAVNYSETSTEKNQYDDFVRYWEDSYSRSSALSILAVCTPGMGFGVDQKAWNISGSDAGYLKRPWSEITSGSGTTPYTSIAWPIGNESSTDQSKYTKDKKNQDVSFIKNQDLCFSNNIGDWSSVSEKTDARLKFNSNNDRKFDSGRMIFYHALSKLTFQIKKGDGFSDENFIFDKEIENGVETETNIKLTNFYNSGIFNIEEGEFIDTDANHLSKLDIKRIYQHPSLTTEEKTAGYKYILDALVIPGTEMNDAEHIGVVFKIAGNEYKLSMQQLYSAIINNTANTGITDWSKYFDKNSTDGLSLLKAGVHYVFTFTVGKTKIQNITAQLMPWETVEAANQFPDNSYVNLSLLTKSGTELTSGVDFYRGLNFYSGTDFYHNWKSYDWQSYNWTTTNAYEKASSPQYKEASGSTSAHWETDWFWDSNRHFYHFRAIVPSGQELQDNGNSTTADPKVSLKAERIVQNGTDSEGNPTYSSNYTDVMWGAPFLATDNKLTYSITKGFDGKGAEATEESSRTHQIHWAIGPTKDEIKLVTFHLMSEVTIKIQTSTDGSADQVMLGDGTNSFTKVELLNCASEGTANVGDGCVTATNADVSQILADNISSSNNTVSWGVIPQSLEGKKLRIVTPDDNEYVVDLADVVVSTASQNNISTYTLANPYPETETGSGKYKINYWYPNYKYTYTFILLKMGIANLSATYVDWETVTADDETVQIQ